MTETMGQALGRAFAEGMNESFDRIAAGSAPTSQATETTNRTSTKDESEVTPIQPPSTLLLTIRALGGLLDDLERIRIMNGNRIGAAERQLGDALPQLHAAQEALALVEHQAELELKRAWRKHPLAPWARGYHGLGEKSIARLIALIGDPADRVTPAQLRAYCGHGDPARAGAIPKGASQEELFKRGNPHAKRQVWLIATSMLKAGNRAAYDEARAKYADAVHDKLCVRCGPAGHPAQPGTPLSDGHKHARAVRATGKAFLRDLWVAATEIRA